MEGIERHHKRKDEIKEKGSKRKEWLKAGVKTGWRITKWDENKWRKSKEPEKKANWMKKLRNKSTFEHLSVFSC